MRPQRGDLGLFNRFFEMAEFDYRLSSSFISPISKVASPTGLNDFRSISLLGWVHKLVTRVLARRLRRVMGKLVRDTRTTFIKGRSFFEDWTLASEVLDAMKKVGGRCCF